MTPAEAYEAILTRFNTAWLGDVASASVPVAWDGVFSDGSSPDVNNMPGPWAEIYVQHVGGQQSALIGASGNTKHEITGLVSIMIFTPVGKGQLLGLQLSDIAASAFQGVSTPNGVWFREVGYNGSRPDGNWIQSNVIATFEYDQIR